MTSVLEIEKAISALPLTDRSYLAKKILRSFEDPDQISDEEKELLDRRSHEMTTGQVKPLSLDELKNKLGS